MTRAIYAHIYETPLRVVILRNGRHGRSARSWTPSPWQWSALCRFVRARWSVEELGRSEVLVWREHV